MLGRRLSGQIIAEFNLGLALTVMIVIAVATIFAFVVALATQAHAAGVALTGQNEIISSLYRDTDLSKTPFIPTQDVAGNANTDAHEIDFYIYGLEKNAYVATFVAYCEKTSGTTCQATQPTNSIQRYTYRWADLPQHGGSTGAAAKDDPWTGPTSLIATMYDGAAGMKTIPSAANYFATHPPTCVQRVYHFSYPGVTAATCRIFTVQLAYGAQNVRTIVLSKSHVPQALQLIVGTATPTPNPMLVTGAPLTFRAPIVGAASLSVAESNYGNRSTTPAQVYTLAPSTCADTGAGGYPSGRTDASYTPASTLTPAGDGSGAGTIVVTPTIQTLPTGPATCTFTLTDNTNQSSTVTATIGQTYTPSATGATISYTNGATAPVVVTEQNYATAPSGGMTAAIGNNATGACASIAPNGSSLSADGTYTETETWTLAFAKAGACTVTFTDKYGQTAIATMTANASASMDTWPAYVRYGTSGAAFAGACWYNGTCSNTFTLCGAQALQADGSTIDAAPPAWTGTSTDSDGCYSGKMYMRETSGQSVSWLIQNNSCNFTIYKPLSFDTLSGPSSALNGTSGSSTGACSITLDDGSGASKSLLKGVVDVTVFQSADWEAAYSNTWSTGCDMSTDPQDCTPATDTGTAPCHNPTTFTSAGNVYVKGYIIASEMTPNNGRGGMPSGSTQMVSPGDYGTPNGGGQFVQPWNDLQVSSCYDASQNMAGQNVLAN